MKAAPNNSGTRNNRNLANIDSITPIMTASPATFARYTRRPTAMAAGVRLVAIPQGANTFTSNVKNTSNLIPAAHSINAR